MTALTVPARAEEDASLRPVPWRRHRIALASLAVFLGALAVRLWRVGLGLHHAYDGRDRVPPGDLACLR